MPSAILNIEGSDKILNQSDFFQAIKKSWMAFDYEHEMKGA